MNEERKLFELTKKGDEAAFEEIYRKTEKLVFYIAYSILKCREDADEVTQDAFIAFFNHVNEIRNYNAYKPWLIKVTKNLAISKLRSKKEQYILDNDSVDTFTDNSIDRVNKVFNELEGYLTDHELDILVLYVKFNIKLKDIAKIEGKKEDAFYKEFKKISKKVQKIRKNQYEQKR